MGPFLGGDEGNRTPDPLLAKQVLSQLSYTPMLRVSFFQCTFPVPSKLNNAITSVSTVRQRLEAELGVLKSSSLFGSP